MMDLSDRLLPNQSPEPTGVTPVRASASDSWLLDVIGRRWLSFFR